MILIYCTFLFAIVWLLAVYKVFILDDGLEYTEKIRQNKASFEAQQRELEDTPKELDFVSSGDVKKVEAFKRVPKKFAPIVINTKTPPVDDGLMKWPSVLKDGTIPAKDGHDIMPFSGLEVPKFYTVPQGTDLNKMGSKVGGQETIFLMIASYRDFQCKETITSAFSRADHPERLFIAAVDQTVPGNGEGCLELETPCEQDPSQVICRYRDQITVYHMDAEKGTGPVTARHIGDRLYRGEYFVMQMDAHCWFVRHWDTKIVEQWKQTGNEMAVLSSYLSDVQGSISKAGDSLRETRPIMCNSDFEGEMPARYLRHGSQPEEYATIRNMPQLQPFWAAGFSFSRGHFTMRVPYDGYQPMVFQGEEISIGIRGFTHGYDFYAPRDSVVFHEYASMSGRRKAVKMFWENSQEHAGEMKKSLRRSTSIIQMATDIDPDTWDHREVERYGLGTARDLHLFYRLFLIDVTNRKATPLCPLVTTAIMHNDFQPYLRPDGLGIDYTPLAEYDAKAAIARGRGQPPHWQRQLEAAADLRDRQKLQAALDVVNRFDLAKKNPSLVSNAQALLRIV